MKEEILGEIKEKIQQSQMVLVGIGEQTAVKTRGMDEEDKYVRLIKQLPDEENYPYFQQIYIEENKKVYLDFYNRLYDLIKDKNYFIVSTNVDDVIYESKLDSDRIVTPCGSIHQFVCNECKKDIFSFEGEKVIQNKERVDNQKNVEMEKMHCPICNRIMRPNMVFEEYYDEKGYLEKWNKYTRWLQGTVNKNLCILELGVGLGYPTVIRWPNEKIVTYNNKAYLFRIHKTLYQLSEGISERARSVDENPMEVI